METNRIPPQIFVVYTIKGFHTKTIRCNTVAEAERRAKNIQANNPVESIEIVEK